MSRFLLSLCLLSLSACAILPGGKPVARSTVYLLETEAAVAESESGCEIVVINPAQAAPGQFGAQMLYQRKPNQIERFAYSRWAASPGAMIDPLLLNTLRASQRFTAVLSSPAPVHADLRIENDDLRLIQKFEEDRSFVELRMSSRVYSPDQRRLVASRQFSYREPAAESTPGAGVEAANLAVGRLLTDFSVFVIDAAGRLDRDCPATE